jgi:ABC-type sugar transport system ATPase subunit
MTSNVSKKDVFAIDNLNLRVRMVKPWVILGPSGCGKTTLLGLSPDSSAESGLVMYNGVEVRELPPETGRSAWCSRIRIVSAFIR